MYQYIVGKDLLTKSQQVVCERIATCNMSEFDYIGRVSGMGYTYMFTCAEHGDSITGPIEAKVKSDLRAAGLADIVTGQKRAS